MHDGPHLPRRPQPPASVDPVTAQHIDLCRPGSDDCLLPELRDPQDRSLAARLQRSAAALDRYHRVQELDCRICTALDDVPVPHDLADRILTRLAETAPVPAALAATADSGGAQTQPAAAPRTPAAPRRAAGMRRLWIAAAVAAASLAVIVPLAMFLSGRTLQHSGSVVGRLRDSAAQLAADPAFSNQAAWRTDRPEPGSSFPSDVVGAAVAWQPATVAGIPSIAYRLVGPRCQAVLFVAQRSVRGFATSPEAARQPVASGMWVGVWQSPSGDALYVLVVGGSEQDFLDFVRPKSVAERSPPAPPAPLALGHRNLRRPGGGPPHGHADHVDGVC